MTLQEIQSITPDEKGIIEVDGRRFVKEKLIVWIEKTYKVKEVKPKRIPKIKPVRERKHQRLVKVVRNGIKIKAKKDDVVIGTFISLADCAKSIGVVKSSISKHLNKGMFCKGYTFEKIAS